MRNIVIVLNLRTKKKIALSNRKLSYLLYEKISLAHGLKYVSYPHFSITLGKGPYRLLDYEFNFLPLHNPMAEDIDEVYQFILTAPIEPINQDDFLRVDINNAIPMTFGKSSRDAHQESDTVQIVPDQES